MRVIVCLIIFCMYCNGSSFSFWCFGDKTPSVKIKLSSKNLLSGNGDGVTVKACGISLINDYIVMLYHGWEGKSQDKRMIWTTVRSGFRLSLWGVSPSKEDHIAYLFSENYHVNGKFKYSHYITVEVCELKKDVSVTKPISNDDQYKEKFRNLKNVSDIIKDLNSNVADMSKCVMNVYHATKNDRRIETGWPGDMPLKGGLIAGSGKLTDNFKIETPDCSDTQKCPEN